MFMLKHDLTLYIMSFQPSCEREPTCQEMFSYPFQIERPYITKYLVYHNDIYYNANVLNDVFYDLRELSELPTTITCELLDYENNVFKIISIKKDLLVNK